MKTKFLINSIIIPVIIFASFGAMPNQQNPAQAATIVRVKPGGGTSAGCGSTWGDACELQTALTSASAGDEIWAAMGTYYPGTNRDDTFQLKSGVALYGGFAGTETARGQRDWDANETILSGDIGVTDDKSDNSYHVVTGSGVDSTAILDGFTVTGGNADSEWPNSDGGGMYIDGGGPILTNLIFNENRSVSQGGGIYNDDGSPELMNVTFSGNSAEFTGGGMYNKGNSVLTNITFNDNTAEYSGGGMENLGSNTTLTNVSFSGNTTNGKGGGMFTIGSPVLTNVTFIGNVAIDLGGGMLNSYSNSSLTNATFMNNHAAHGGGMSNISSSLTLVDVNFNGNTAEYNGGGMDNLSSYPTLANVFFSENSANFGGGMYNSYSDLTLTNIIFSDNHVKYDGGGIYNFGGSSSLVNVTFINNKAENGGGGIGNWYSEPMLTNVTLSGNTAKYNGGGMLNLECSPSLTNVILSGNEADYGGGIYNWEGSNPTITNTILWGNSANITGPQIYNDETSSKSSLSFITYSNIQSGCTAISGNDCSGGGNIAIDPLFVRNPDPGPDGKWGTVDDDYGDLRLQIGSPAIDAGDNTAPGLAGITTDLDGNPRFYDVPEIADTGVGPPPVVDMGAYEVVNIGPLEIYLPVIVR